MISDITLGQFFPGNSWIHRLDPRTKILLAVLFIVTVFLADSPVIFAGLILFTLFLVGVTRISLRRTRVCRTVSYLCKDRVPP